MECEYKCLPYPVPSKLLAEAERYSCLLTLSRWTHLCDPEVPPPKALPSLTSLFSEIRSTVEVEAQIISAVFPSPLIVMQTFLQRVFAQSVQGYVEVLMEKAAEVGAEAQTQLQAQIQAASGTSATAPTTMSDGFHSLAFLRALRMARSSALSLVNDLKLYDYRGMLGASSTAPGGSLVTESHPLLLGNGLSLPSSGVTGDSLAVPGAASSPLSSNGAGSSHLGGGTTLSVMLDQAVEELFVPYMEGTRYLEKESKSLKELYGGCLAKFSAWHRSSQKVKTTTLFDRIRTQVSSSSTGTGVSSTGLSSGTGASGGQDSNGHAPTSVPSTKSTFMKLSGLVDRARGATTASAIPASTAGAIDASDAEVRRSLDAGNDAQQSDDAEGDLNLELAEKMLRWHAEAIGRCVDLSQASDV